MQTTTPILPTHVETRPPTRPLPFRAPARVQTAWLSREQIPEFAERYSRAAGVLVSLDALLDSEIRGFFLQGRPVAGYRLGRSATRYGAMAGDRVSDWPFDVDEAAEITHLWIAPDASSAVRRIVYGWILADLLAPHKTIVVGGSVSHDITRQQMRSMPHLLHEVACPTVRPGGFATLYYGTVHTVVADAIASGVPLPWLGGFR